MPDATLKDVLDAIAQLDAKIDRKVEELRREMATGRDLAEVRQKMATIGALANARQELAAKIDAHSAETKKGFEDLDRELTGHAAVHREIEKDIEAIKRPHAYGCEAHAPSLVDVWRAFTSRRLRRPDPCPAPLRAARSSAASRPPRDRHRSLL